MIQDRLDHYLQPFYIKKKIVLSLENSMWFFRVRNSTIVKALTLLNIVAVLPGEYRIEEFEEKFGSFCGSQ